MVGWRNSCRQHSGSCLYLARLASLDAWRHYMRAWRTGAPFEGRGMSELVETKEDLIRYFEGGAKPRDQWRVGTEYEKIAVSADDGRALPFSGPRGVEEMLKRLADRFGYEPDLEHGRIVGLKGDRASITIEPGAQIELS